MKKNNFFLIKDIENMFPSEQDMLQDAKQTFPRHPMYKDVNKKYREGYIRGQIDLIRRMKEQMKVVRNRQHVKPYYQEPFEKKETKNFRDILKDKELTTMEKINKLESELETTLDIKAYNDIRTQIDLLEDKISMNQNIKRKNTQIEFL